MSNTVLRILIVEDSKGDAILIKKALDAALQGQCAMDLAETLAQALKLLAEEAPYDIALLDRTLPDAEGATGLHSIQNMAPELPVVFITAYKDEQTAFESIKQGAQDYLSKDGMDYQAIRKTIHYAMMRKQYESELITRANYDPLTGLANRLMFENRLDMALARMRRANANLSVLFLDLDKFKAVNDTHGHLMGDRLLQATAEKIKLVLRPYDTAARFGGDEFAIMLENIPDMRHGEVVARKIIKLFDSAIEVEGLSLDVNISIGVASCGHSRPLPRDALMEMADSAMYAAKAIPGNACHIHSDVPVLHSLVS